MAGCSSMFVEIFRLSVIPTWVCFEESKIFHGKLFIWIKLLVREWETESSEGTKSLNCLHFTLINLYFYSKEKKQEQLFYSLHESLLTAAFTQLSEVQVQAAPLKQIQLQLEPLGLISWALTTRLLNIQACFPSSCFSQRTSRGLKVPFMQNMT